ncbi:MAG: U32 family peptidase [Clostridia bacterium]|nr:U32 family peptidase [Clostridia bacterium]
MNYELLAPAGDLNTARVAMRYGADAVYMGGSMLQLRAKSVGFSMDDIAVAVKEAHGTGKKIYVTVNSYARDDELDMIPAYARQLQDIGVDAAIISDPGVMAIFHEAAPCVDIHVSTQANCTNSATAKAYYALGARRVVPARELSLEQLRMLRKNLPDDMEIESFIHGAMCMSYSGRCMMSAFMTGRSGNRGECTHPCRWKYHVVEEKRPGQFFPVEEDAEGMAIFSSYDLNCIGFMDQLMDAGIASFKIEGRMKSEYYVATVVSAYRRRIDDILSGRKSDLRRLRGELESVSHRPYSTGFYFGELKSVGGDGGEYVQGCQYSADVISVQEGRAEIKLKNKFRAGDVLEAVTPDGADIKFEVRNIVDPEGVSMPDAPVPTRTYFIDCPDGISAGDILRRRL